MALSSGLFTFLLKNHSSQIIFMILRDWIEDSSYFPSWHESKYSFAMCLNLKKKKKSYKEKVFFQISSKTEPWHQLLCMKSVFKNDISLSCITLSRCSVWGENVCFLNFLICVTPLSPLSIWYLSVNPLEAKGHLLGDTFGIIRLIAFQNKRKFSLVKWYNFKNDFFFSDNMAKWKAEPWNVEVGCSAQVPESPTEWAASCQQLHHMSDCSEGVSDLHLENK